MAIHRGYMVLDQGSASWSNGFGKVYNEIQDCQAEAAYPNTHTPMYFDSYEMPDPNNPSKTIHVGLFAEKSGELDAFFADGKKHRTGLTADDEKNRFAAAAALVTQNALVGTLAQPMAPDDFKKNPPAFAVIAVK